MTFRNLTWLCIFLIFYFPALAQDEPVRPDRNNSFLTFDTFSAFLFRSPRYTVGYVTPIHRRWLVGLDLGYGNNKIMPSHFNESDLIGHNFRLFEVKPRVFFKLKPSSKFQPYVSAELFYINHKDHFVNSTEFIKSERYINLPDDFAMEVGYGAISYDSADYIRYKSGINFNIGLFLTLIDNFGVNLDAGLGFRNRYVMYQNVENPSQFTPNDSENFVPNPLTVEMRNQGGANLTLNLKVFYKFDSESRFLKGKSQRFD